MSGSMLRAWCYQTVTGHRATVSTAPSGFEPIAWPPHLWSINLFHTVYKQSYKMDLQCIRLLMQCIRLLELWVGCDDVEPFSYDLWIYNLHPICSSLTGITSECCHRLSFLWEVPCRCGPQLFPFILGRCNTHRLSTQVALNPYPQCSALLSWVAISSWHFNEDMIRKLWRNNGFLVCGEI